ncbi:hypothetical protein SAMN04487859_11351 [Roseovarius lutimaris]|uniref:Hemolysin-type calcium-binding repeat-containing protein n=1 Tax=Roseovarius lutimaris TaxID=1005928 RepID=A0A1I5DQ69_9RHOB|nr:hypothetical protein [Roseovarius lutimaris]SFO01399.1 hypothetical protein SAMN04487859_11351 [Roseovarius lutimaris]
MLALMLAAMGLLSASFIFDDNNDPVPPSDEEDPTGEQVGDGGDVSDTSVGGVLAMWNELDDLTDTSGDDAIGVEYDREFDPEAGGFVPLDNFADGGAGDDRMYLNGGTAAGGEGNDTISMFFSLGSDVLGEDAFPVALGGTGEDLIVNVNTQAVIDAGEGNDTVSFDRPFGLGDDIDVTLGEGEDLIQVVDNEAPSRIIAELHDFDPAQDRIEIVRAQVGQREPEPVSGFDVTVEPLEGEEASLLSIALQLEDAEADPETFQFLVHGLDPSQAEDIQIGIVDEEPASDEPLEPLRDGTDLVFNIGADDPADFSTSNLNLALQEANPLADITRVVLNVDPTLEGTFDIFDSTTFSGSSSGADGSSAEYLQVVYTPPEFEGGPMTSYSIIGDDSTYLAADGPPDGVFIRPPEFLAPSAEVARIFLGSVTAAFNQPEDGFSTVNDVEIVINRLPVVELGTGV